MWVELGNLIKICNKKSISLLHLFLHGTPFKSNLSTMHHAAGVKFSFACGKEARQAGQRVVIVLAAFVSSLDSKC